MVMLMNIPKYAAAVAEYAQSMLKAMGFGGNQPAAAPPKMGEPFYAGVALTVQPEQISFDLWIPGASAKEFQKAFGPLIGAFGAPGSN
jgi:hypothetical protein